MQETPLYSHPAPHRELGRRWRTYLSLEGAPASVVGSILLFIVSILVSYYAIAYATLRASNPVTDIVLSNIPVFNVDGLFVYGTLIMIAFLTLLCIVHPKRIPFILYSLSIFWLIRSAFTSLTHIAPFPTQATIDLSINLGSFILRFFNGDDLFFSGHVGTAFLMALIFWRHRVLRYIFIAWSLYFSIIVLLGHYHYSIDVLSAYFITYTIYVMALWLFPRAHDWFEA